MDMMTDHRWCFCCRFLTVVLMSTPHLVQLAWDLESRGFEGHEVAVRQVVRSARIAGVSRILVDVLADPTEPEVARMRAFGRIAAALAASPTTTDDHTGHDAAA
jgi:hypothetical protein